MKEINKRLIGLVAVIGFSVSSCVDDIRFGNDFLEKAPGGSVTMDTVFNNAEYARQFLTGIYALQYYGLQYSNSSNPPYTHSYWIGKFEALSDLWVTTWTGFSMYGNYYSGTHTAGYGIRADKFDYTRSNVWEAVRYAWLFLEKIEEVPGMDASEKERLKAEAKCLIASRYWDMFRHYGGIPILKGSFSGTDATYEMPRGTVEETVNFMTELLDEAAAVLPWQVGNSANEAGRWTKAGAMGLKTSILLFAASPLFNDNQPYMEGEAATNHNVWYGGYKSELWDRCLTACEDFFRELSARQQFALEQAAGTRPEDYRLAFRKAYYRLTSTEVLHSVRVLTSDSHTSGTYSWWQLQNANGRGYNPTHDYVEMFPWADGTPFDWNKAEQEGLLDEMFIERVNNPADGVVLTRDPRLYETAIVNGLPKSLDWTTGNMSGNVYEIWVGGYDSKQAQTTEHARYATGYTLQKYFLGDNSTREDVHWCYLRLAEVYLNYAEALCQKGQLTEAVRQVDIIRARVGMKGLVESNPGKNLTTDKDALLAEILRERACELGMEDSRFFDMIRYKMKSKFEQPLYMLMITRTDKEGQWFGADKDAGVPWPAFRYEKKRISSPTRVWWTNGFDPKWYLSPFPLGEINKGYGLVQNPGW
ncbi:MAG: RagB/SusD family nutrient uptake outer membrane protein [Tannerella sp.]|jgi:hypothetical protein|nr:RagB/SusD family nutrient uptake outer membrane protein [Tannerella sp.]